MASPTLYSFTLPNPSSPNQPTLQIQVTSPTQTKISISISRFNFQAYDSMMKNLQRIHSILDQWKESMQEIEFQFEQYTMCPANIVYSIIKQFRKLALVKVQVKGLYNIDPKLKIASKEFMAYMESIYGSGRSFHGHERPGGIELIWCMGPWPIESADDLRKPMAVYEGWVTVRNRRERARREGVSQNDNAELVAYAREFDAMEAARFRGLQSGNPLVASHDYNMFSMARIQNPARNMGREYAATPVYFNGAFPTLKSSLLDLQIPSSQNNQIINTSAHITGDAAPAIDSTRELSPSEDNTGDSTYNPVYLENLPAGTRLRDCSMSYCNSWSWEMFVKWDEIPVDG